MGMIVSTTGGNVKPARNKLPTGESIFETVTKSLKDTFELCYPMKN